MKACWAVIQPLLVFFVLFCVAIPYLLSASDTILNILGGILVLLSVSFAACMIAGHFKSDEKKEEKQ